MCSAKSFSIFYAVIFTLSRKTFLLLLFNTRLFILEEAFHFFRKTFLFLFFLGCFRRGCFACWCISIELTQQVFLPFAHICRNLHLQCNDLVASYLRIPQVRHTHTTQSYYCIGLCTGLDGIFLFPIDGLDGDLAAQSRLHKCDGHIAIDIEPFPDEYRLGCTYTVTSRSP